MVGSVAEEGRMEGVVSPARRAWGDGERVFGIRTDRAVLNAVRTPALDGSYGRKVHTPGTER
jgi:hypothetical protein